jgi:hypothetical protein
MSDGKTPERFHPLPACLPDASDSPVDDTSTSATAVSSTYEGTDDDGITIDMVVCSFALHLLESPSELFALLWELSTKARWLVILAPHKRPAVRRTPNNLVRHLNAHKCVDQGRMGMVQIRCPGLELRRFQHGQRRVTSRKVGLSPNAD